jgi:hypothetical protein
MRVKKLTKEELQSEPNRVSEERDCISWVIAKRLEPSLEFTVRTAHTPDDAPDPIRVQVFAPTRACGGIVWVTQAGPEVMRAMYGVSFGSYHADDPYMRDAHAKVRAHCSAEREKREGTTMPSCLACEVNAEGWSSDSPPPLCSACESDACREVECDYCGRDTIEAPVVPGPDDDGAWRDLARAHWPDCEWIATRAHRRWVGYR